MPREKSAGAIIYRMENDVPQYLLLHYTPSNEGKRGQWGFAKGHVEQGENDIQTAKREISEETGIKDLKFISLYFDHLDNQTGTNKVWLVRYKCGMIYFASDNYDMALIKHKELESIQQLYDDLFGVYGTNFGFSYEFEKLNNVEEIKKQLDTYN